MDDNAVRTITPEEAQRAPRDLDDLIFQGEPWWVSEDPPAANAALGWSGGWGDRAEGDSVFGVTIF